MSRILLVIGLASTKSAAEPELVYLGRSGEAMRLAIANATQPRLILVPYVHGISKNNPRAGGNLAAQLAELDAEAKDEPDLVATLEHLTGQKDELQKLLSLAEDAYRAASARAEKLANELADMNERVKLQSQAYARDMSALTDQLNAAQREAVEAKAQIPLPPPAEAASVPASVEPGPAAESPTAAPESSAKRRR